MIHSLYKGYKTMNTYQIITHQLNELYTLKAFINGDEIIHVKINENELIELESMYLNNGLIKYQRN